jgi:hypothetical protein
MKASNMHVAMFYRKTPSLCCHIQSLHVFQWSKETNLPIHPIISLHPFIQLGKKKILFCQIAMYTQNGLPHSRNEEQYRLVKW